MITRDTLINALGRMTLDLLEAQDTLIAANKRIADLEAEVAKPHVPASEK